MGGPHVTQLTDARRAHVKPTDAHAKWQHALPNSENSANRDLYNQRYLLIADSMRKIYKSDIDVAELPLANASQMNALLLKLMEFRAVSDTDPK